MTLGVTPESSYRRLINLKDQLFDLKNALENREREIQRRAVFDKIGQLRAKL
jgi:hypothetical protein